MKKRIMTGNSEIEIEDTDSVERMRHRDTDGDGVVDYIDKLQDAGFNHESQPSKTNPNNRIIRFTESQTADIDRILSPALRRGVMK